MNIKIKTEKIVLRGVAYRKVIEMSGVLPKGELPEEYIVGRNHSGEKPRIFAQGDAIIVCSYAGSLFVGRAYLEADFQQSLAAIKAAGDHLHDINIRIKHLQQEWKGEETFII